MFKCDIAAQIFLENRSCKNLIGPKFYFASQKNKENGMSNVYNQLAIG